MNDRLELSYKIILFYEIQEGVEVEKMNVTHSVSVIVNDILNNRFHEMRVGNSNINLIMKITNTFLF